MGWNEDMQRMQFMLQGKPQQQSGGFNATLPPGQVDPYSDFMKGVYSPDVNKLGATDPSWWQKLTGYKDASGMETMGFGTAGLGLLQAGLGAYGGFKQLGLAEDSLEFQKDSFSKQFENQRTLTNGQLQDRHATRVASNPGYWADKTPVQV